MMRKLFGWYVLPILLAGIAITMQQYQIISGFVGYALIGIALMVLLIGLFRDKRWSPLKNFVFSSPIRRKTNDEIAKEAFDEENGDDNNRQLKEGIIRQDIQNQLIDLNNPDLFLELNETGLKCIINAKVEESESKMRPIVSKITLHMGHASDYEIVIQALDKDIDFPKVESFWNRSPRDIFNDMKFAERVYRKTPKEDFWEEWGCFVVSDDKPFDKIVFGKEHWILFKR